jgi:hypothetical protein
MASDFFYNFSNKIDEDESLKLNLDELYNKKQQQEYSLGRKFVHPKQMKATAQFCLRSRIAAKKRCIKKLTYQLLIYSLNGKH